MTKASAAGTYSKVRAGTDTFSVGGPTKDLKKVGKKVKFQAKIDDNK